MLGCYISFSKNRKFHKKMQTAKLCSFKDVYKNAYIKSICKTIYIFIGKYKYTKKVVWADTKNIK